MELALDYAQRGGVVATQQAGDGIDWALTRAGATEIDATRSWYSDALSRFAAQIQERATLDFGGVSNEQADLWAAILVKIFSDAIVSSPDVYTGAVSKSASGNVRPISLNGARMLTLIHRLDAPEATTDFLTACLLASIDESDPFGNELVNHVATSCVLHSIIAGRSRAEAQGTLGSLAGQRIVLDTPVLVAYLGPDDTAAHLATVVRLSRETGMQVIVPEHVIEELLDVVTRVEDQYIPGLKEALRGGVGARVYASSVNEQVLELFLEAVEVRRYKNWEEFAERARQINNELEDLGVVVRHHRNLDRVNVDALNDQLKTLIAAGNSFRGAKQIARDAESIEMVWRARRRSSRDDLSLWPGGWLITHDRKISPTYQRVNPKDKEPLVLSLGQWATLVTQAAPAPEVRELIEAAASFLRQEAVLRIAVKYPPDVALNLAQTLGQGSPSETDIRVAQLTLGDLLNNAGSGQIQGRESISTFVANKRSSRQAIAAEVQRKAFVSERSRMAETVTKNAAELSVVASERASAERAAAASFSEIERLRSEKADIEKAQAEYLALNGRRVVRIVVSVVALIVAVLLFVLGVPGFAVGTLIGLVIFLNEAREWTKNKAVGSGKLFLALLPQLFGLWDILRS
ncbi:hypothetical protein MT355_10755 [Rathayibacter sp. VKM Ac-2929]|uniref:hypothetical protein n=1 Tax=Rathayibacter sp. VKM Ac-2929 TaxID=2929480 RepID=UPI001FB1C6E0|nr:hypothetical protein [Rathayibacter sp. VKM Ac-2929]MCJ1673732.1 hypothetical protein [Rathayibacter sp. VKM Ac-2929]